MALSLTQAKLVEVEADVIVRWGREKEIIRIYSSTRIFFKAYGMGGGELT